MLESENWYVLYTKPRKEKKVTSKLEEIGVNAYCPLVKTVRQWSDRKKKILTPLIPSCIFIHCKESERNNAFDVPGTSHYLFWLGKPAIVKNSEIETIKEWLKGDISEANVQELKTGDTYIMQNKGFNGQEGVISEVSKNRVQIVLKELGIKVTITKEKSP
jgi:transcriptional antiterminator RfaH